MVLKMTIMCKALTRNAIFTAGHKANLYKDCTHMLSLVNLFTSPVPSLKLSWVQTDIKHTNTL